MQARKKVKTWALVEYVSAYSSFFVAMEHFPNMDHETTLVLDFTLLR